VARQSSLLIILFFVGCTSSEKVFDPDKAKEYLLEGVKAKKEGQLQDAIEAFTKSLRFHPSYAQAYYQRALCFLQLRKVEGTGIPTRQLVDNALRNFTFAINASPTFSDAYFSRAMVLLSRARYREAVADLLVCCRYSPRDVDPHLHLAQIYETRFEGKSVLAMNHYIQYAELGGTDEGALAKAQAWQALQKDPVKEEPVSQNDEKHARELHEEFKLLFAEEKEEAAIKVLGELVEKYKHTRYFKGREVGLTALYRSLKGTSDKP
jgi:tetratricopeptide (TPR) repeat protein